MDDRKRRLVIIDTDPGVDDVLAILLAIASPELEILAFIVSFGNTDVHAAYANIYKLYQAIGRHLAAHPEDKERFPNFAPDVPPILALGPDGPLEGGRHFAQYFHGQDGLSNITERHPDLNVTSIQECEAFERNFTPSQKSGVEVALELLESRPERSITYIVLGPLTNLALLQRQHGQTLRDRIGRVIIMGGALDVPGNTSPVAEFNFYADPYAAKELLCPIKPGNGLPLERVVLTTLDITTPHELPFPFYTSKIDPEFDSSSKPSVADTKTPICHFTSSFLERTREIMIEFGKDAMELHDIVAIWCAIDNVPDMAMMGEHELPTMEPLWTVVKRKFDIERTGEITRGMLVVDRREDKTAYAPGTNRAEVQAVLEQSHQQHGLLESTALPAQVDVESVEAAYLVHDGASTGVACVVQTPGPRLLLQLLTKRVWGVDVE